MTMPIFTASERQTALHLTVCEMEKFDPLQRDGYMTLWTTARREECYESWKARYTWSPNLEPDSSRSEMAFAYTATATALAGYSALCAYSLIAQPLHFLPKNFSITWTEVIVTLLGAYLAALMSAIEGSAHETEIPAQPERVVCSTRRTTRRCHECGKAYLDTRLTYTPTHQDADGKMTGGYLLQEICSSPTCNYIHTP